MDRHRQRAQAAQKAEKEAQAVRQLVQVLRYKQQEPLTVNPDTAAALAGSVPAFKRLVKVAAREAGWSQPRYHTCSDERIVVWDDRPVLRAVGSTTPWDKRLDQLLQ